MVNVMANGMLKHEEALEIPCGISRKKATKALPNSRC